MSAWGRFALAVVVVFLGTSTPASTHASGATPEEFQACVERWNWMGYTGMFGRESSIPARVQARPCRIEVAYRPHRSGNREFFSFYFPCRLNRFGAYVCPEHGYGLPSDPPRRGHNARYSPRSGRIRLDRPPARPVVVVKPEWVRRYPVHHGFIVPFDPSGRLRAGLALRGRVGLPCQTFASIRHRSRLLGCGAGQYCFVPRLPVRDGMRLACPAGRGSRTFRRTLLIVHS